MFLWPSKNFLFAHKHQVIVSKGPCKHQILPLKSLKPYKTTKNRWVLTFSRLKTVWSIARHRRWLLRMSKDLNKSIITYFDVLSALENFLSSHERRAFISKSSIFEQILEKFWFWRAFETMKSQKSSNADVFDFKNCLRRRTMLPIASACSHGPKLMPNNLFWCS